MSARHSGKYGASRWPTHPVGTQHISRFSGLLSVTLCSVGHERWDHVDLREEMWLSRPGGEWRRGHAREVRLQEAVPAWNPG